MHAIDMCSVLLLSFPSLSIDVNLKFVVKLRKGRGWEADSKIDYLIVANYSTRRRFDGSDRPSALT